MTSIDESVSLGEEDESQLITSEYEYELGQTLKSISQVKLTDKPETQSVVDVSVAHDNARAMQEGTEPDSIHPGSISDIINIPGFRGKTNTPASYYTDATAIKPGLLNEDTEDIPQRFVSDSRERFFHQAMDLMTERCSSTVGDSPGSRPKTPLVTYKTQPLGFVPTFFYIEQKKPTNVPPLKAWRGYTGNVYFEPIQVKSAEKFSSHTYNERKLEVTHEKQPRIMSCGRNKSRNSSAPNPREKRLGRAIAKSAMSSASYSPCRQMAILDKTEVLNRYDNNIHEDMMWIIGQESTGSLCARKNSRNGNYEKGKICRGSVVHKRCGFRNEKMPLLTVNGGKVIETPYSTPLLRSQTQYSHSNQRSNINTPDLTRRVLPTLEKRRPIYPSFKIPGGQNLIH